MGLERTATEGSCIRFRGEQNTSASIVDVALTPDEPIGQVAVGSIHQVAWRTPDDDEQAHWHGELSRRGYAVSPVMDRIYFHSICFRDPGGVLFETATDSPGFLI